MITRMRVPVLAGRPLIYLALVVGLGISVLPLGRATPSQGAHLFTETGKTVSGRFFETWQGPYTYQESVAINGYPISDVHAEVSPTDGKTYQVQWFERARYEAHPEKAAPDDVQLGLLGRVATRDRTGEPAFAPVARPANLGPALAWFPETQHTIRGTFLQFWTQYGSWKQFGFPISEEFAERSQVDGQTYTVQYFERNRFEHHPGSAPQFGDVVLGQLGVEQYLHPAPAAGPTPTPAPGAGPTPPPAGP